jgi:hypothetical protein
MKTILNMWEGVLSYRFHSRFKENTQKEHAEIKLGKLDAHLEVSARKSLVYFAQQMTISASIAWIETKICIYISTRQLWFIDYTVVTVCNNNGVNWYLRMVYDGQIDPTLILFGNKAWFHSSGYANSQNNRKSHINSPYAITWLRLVCGMLWLQPSHSNCRDGGLGGSQNRSGCGSKEESLCSYQEWNPDSLVFHPITVLTQVP